MTSVTGISSVKTHVQQHLESPRDKTVRELELHGYVVDLASDVSAGGTLCRHAAAPSLLVWDDGRIELPAGQRTAPSPAKPPQTGVRLGRTMLFVALLCGAILTGLILTALIVE
jgi:hypothetical protein